MPTVLKFRRPDPAVTSDDTLAQLLQWVSDSEDYFQEANDRARRDRDYYDGRQWSDQDAEDRESLGRAVLTMNRIGRKVRFLKGYETKNRTSPKALPRTPAHQQAADVGTEGLRYVADSVFLNQKFSDAYENLLIEGIEALEVTAKQAESGGIDPDINLIPWDRLLYDPYSRQKDFSDARYLGVVTWMDQDEALAQWPDAEDVITSAFSESETSIYDDRPSWAAATITGRQRVKFAQMYYREKGIWQQAVFTKTGFIVEPAPSVWRDEYKQPSCPIIVGCAFINSDNERYGIVREMIDAQDEINIRHSNAIDFMSTRQTMGEKGAVADVNETKAELLKPKGHVEITPGMRFEVLPTDDLSRGNMEALTLARQEIDLMGPNASMLGKDSRAPSGRAVIAQQEGGLFEIGPLADCHRDVKLRVYRAIWCRIRQFWQGEKWIRVTDDQNQLQFIGLNIPVTYGQIIAQQNGGQIPPEAAMRYGPMLNQQANVQNQISYLDVDIVLDEVAQSAIMQQEQFDSLVQLAQMGGGQIPFKAIVQASQLYGKDDIVKAMDEAQQGAQQAQAQQAEMMAKKLAAEIEKNLASARQADADALAKTITAQIQGLQAQTYALLTPPVQPPPALQPLNASQPGQFAPTSTPGGSPDAALTGPSLAMPLGMPQNPPPPGISGNPGMTGVP